MADADNAGRRREVKPLTAFSHIAGSFAGFKLVAHGSKMSIIWDVDTKHVLPRHALLREQSLG